jgi:hypothetical protein
MEWGWPYSLSTPHEIIATSGRAAARNSGVLLDSDP